MNFRPYEDSPVNSPGRLQIDEGSQESYDDESIKEWLARASLKIKPIPADGNCLFRALAFLICKTEEFHMQLRKDICMYIRANKSEYEAFIEALADDSEELSEILQNSSFPKFETYVSYLEKEGKIY